LLSLEVSLTLSTCELKVIRLRLVDINQILFFGGNLMLDHMTFRVSDIACTKAFYSATLAPLGYSLSLKGSYDGMNILGFAHPDATEPDGKKVDVWFVDGSSPYGGAAA
jgi:hypothetical protein